MGQGLNQKKWFYNFFLFERGEISEEKKYDADYAKCRFYE